jgi:hypothetical protein
VKHIDVLATRGTQRLHAEAKGRTASVGLDVDTPYGQLLHRMPPEALGAAIFAGVVPDTAVVSAERLPPHIRATLGIHLFGVAENGEMDAFHAVRVWTREARRCH